MSDTDGSRLFTVSPGGRIGTLITDPRLAWPAALWIDVAGDLWIPAAQIDRIPVMNGGKNALPRPVEILKLFVGARPSPIDHA